jgi:DNA polymerase III alpha subunit (gram-positive type)
MGLLHVYLDLETTDLHPYSARITEIAAVANTEPPRHFCERVKADRKIKAAASRVTGITDSDLLQCRTRQEVLLSFVEWIQKLDGPVVLLAYNGINFDFPLLIVELKRSNLEKQFGSEVGMFADPLKWAQVHWPKRYTVSSFSMGVVYQKLFEEELKNAHSALVDTRAMVRICEHETFASFVKSLESDHAKPRYTRGNKQLLTLCLQKHKLNLPNRSIEMYLVPRKRKISDKPQ